MQPWRGNITHPQVHNHFVSDAVTQFISYHLFAERSFQEDGYIGWNPLLFGGFGQYADLWPCYFNWPMQLHRFLSFWQAWHFGLAVSFLIAGYGMYFFLRNRNIQSELALFGAIAYMGNWQFIGWVYDGVALHSFCWMPWVLWSLYSWRNGRSAVFIPIFLGLVFLGGTIQQTVFALAAVSCVWLGWVWEDRLTIPDRARSGLLFLLLILLAAGLTAFMFEPTISAYLESNSYSKRGIIGYPNGFGHAILNFLSYPFFTFPFILGSTETFDLWKVFGSDLINPGFFGTLPVLCGFLALFSHRVPMPARLISLAGLVIPLTPLVGILYLRAHLIWILGGSWAAAEYLNALSEKERNRFFQQCGTVLLALIALWTIASLGIALFEPQLQEKLKTSILKRVQSDGGQFGGMTDWMIARAERFTDNLKIWNPVQTTALFGALLSILGLRYLSSRLFLLRNLISLGVALQVTLFWFLWTTWSMERNPYPKTPEAAIFQKIIGQGRLAMNSSRVEDLLFTPNTLFPLNIAISNGYDSIVPLPMKTLSRKSWDFPGVTHFLAKEGKAAPDTWECVWKDKKWRLLKNPNPAMGCILFPTPTESSPPVVKRPSLNTMLVEVPKGAIGVTVFENYHRGWNWRILPTTSFLKATRSDSNALSITFREALDNDKTVELRFIPPVPSWVIALEILSFMGILLLIILPNKLRWSVH